MGRVVLGVSEVVVRRIDTIVCFEYLFRVLVFLSFCGFIRNVGGMVVVRVLGEFFLDMGRV